MLILVYNRMSSKTMTLSMNKKWIQHICQVKRPKPVLIETRTKKKVKLGQQLAMDLANKYVELHIAYDWIQ